MSRIFRITLCATSMLLSVSLSACAEDDRLAGRWSAQWTVTNPNSPTGNPFTQPLPIPDQPLTPTLTIEEVFFFTTVSDRTAGGQFSFHRSEGGRQTMEIAGGYRFRTNRFLNQEDAPQIEFKGRDRFGLPKNWSVVLVSLSPASLTIKGLYGGVTTTYRKVN
jgi:hypothetical protein